MMWLWLGILSVGLFTYGFMAGVSWQSNQEFKRAVRDAEVRMETISEWIALPDKLAARARSLGR